MKQYNIKGMSCAACSARVEKAVSKVSGVTSCSVNLLTNSMSVEGSAADSDIIKAVKNAGYGASSIKNKEKAEDTSTESPIRPMRTRFITSLVFLLILMYFSMGHMMWSFPLPKFYDGNHIAMGLTQLLLTVIIMVINQKFFISGYKSLIHGAPNMDTLVALGATAAFGYSTFALFAMTKAQVAGDMGLVEKYMMEFYFESAAMILTLITLGKMLEAYSKGKTTDALKGLMELAPKSANIIRDGKEVNVPVEEVVKGDIFIVRPGESIPVDGVVIDGHSAVNESSLTGESIPVDKEPDDKVSAATINQSGIITCKALRVGEDTALSKIIKMVSDASATKPHIARIADKVSGIFVPTVIAIAVVTIIVWLLIGKSAGFAIARGISVLVISCPCALGLATPVAIMVGNGKGARNGILFKNAAAIEETGKLKIVALDKTGTITEGKPVVTGIYPAKDITEEELLHIAGSLEYNSEHPLAGAVNQEIEKRKITISPVKNFSALPGNGLLGEIDGVIVMGGNYRFISEHTADKEELKNISDKVSNEGKTPLIFAKDNHYIGTIAVADIIKEDSHKAVSELKKMGIHVVMLTGDNEKTAAIIGKEAGVDEVIAGVLPDGKENVIRELMKKGRTAMVGDGINDAPALTRADTGIAIGAGTDIAIDAADVVLMKSRLTDVAASIRLSKSTLRNIHENLFWAFFYNTIGIPLAAGAFVGLGLTLNPMFGAAAMSLSSFCVVTNALRLNLADIYGKRKKTE
ncbi:heavy metal translocating P-type ATPase [Eshraghiella crossota]|uniref:P-type Cu(+) transporter n=2 Tax=Eshraghiella TaxID=3342669 RepID=D4S245_9FIRM|nr:heavy metal translocating P-type ATPase [Butyrivibrio crossotus]EFF67602.1 copper-exporting ATPase [Butyrivibrio crossotus DSM 2876]UWO51330.1 heavy metal translocating P-type ATPase [Butyrivibrio crossotus]